MPQEQLANLKVLTRARGHLVGQRAQLGNQLQCAIEQIAPMFPEVLAPGSLTALTLVRQFPTPCEWMKKANHKTILNLLETLPRKGKAYAQQKYLALVACAEDAQVTGISLAAYTGVIQCYANATQSLDVQIKAMDDQIKDLSEQMPEVALLKSIPGIGDILASIIVGEIGAIDRFINAKQLVSFSGVDPAVKQSGNFVGNQTRFAIFAACTLYCRHDVCS